MRNHKIGGLPVVADGQLVGIVTETDLARFSDRAAGSANAVPCLNHGRTDDPVYTQHLRSATQVSVLLNRNVC